MSLGHLGGGGGGGGGIEGFSFAERENGFEDRVRGVVAYVRDELHKEFEGDWGALGGVHDMLRDYWSRGVCYARVVGGFGAPESGQVWVVDQVQFWSQW